MRKKLPSMQQSRAKFGSRWRVRSRCDAVLIFRLLLEGTCRADVVCAMIFQEASRKTRFLGHFFRKPQAHGGCRRGVCSGSLAPNAEFVEIKVHFDGRAAARRMSFAGSGYNACLARDRFARNGPFFKTARSPWRRANLRSAC